MADGCNVSSQDEVDDLESSGISKGTEAMWSVSCQVAEQFLVAKAAGETQEEQLANDERYYGRGTKVDPKRVRVGRAPDRGEGTGIDPERRELHKLTNILSELQALLPSGDERHLDELWTPR